MLAWPLIVAMVTAGPPPSNGPTRIRFEVKPPAAVIYLDGKRRGTAGEKPFLVTVTPGRHQVKVTYKKDSSEEPVVAKKGETLNWKYEFETDQPKKPPPAEGTDEAKDAPPDKPAEKPAEDKPDPDLPK
jgi:hypothetical protein